MTQLDSIIRFANLPVPAQVADRLADTLFDLYDILGMLDGEHASSMRWMSPRLQSAFDEINEIMKQFCD